MGRGDREVWYHGTPRQFTTFSVQHGRTFGTGASDVPLFFTKSESFARTYAGGLGTIFRVNLTYGKVFDAEKIQKPSRYWPPERDTLTPEGQKLYDDLEAGLIFPWKNEAEYDEEFYGEGAIWSAILRMDYDIIETTEFKQWLLGEGYDAAFVTGDGEKNIFVFDPGQVEVIDVHDAYPARENPPIVSFDFDDTLQRSDWPHRPHEWIVAELLQVPEEFQVWVITRRQSSMDSLLEIRDFLSLYCPGRVSRIVHTGGELKGDWMRAKGVFPVCHFDDDPEEISALPSSVHGCLVPPLSTL